MEPTNWAPEHAAALREYLAGGMSYAQIALAINAKFNTNYSRSAAIGRARRMGLASAERPGNWGKPPPKSEQASRRRLRERFAAMAKWFAPILEPVEMPKLRCVEVDPRRLTLIELEAGDCRYPYGGENEGEAYAFCGHPRVAGSSYCRPHHALTHGLGTVSERFSVPVALRLVKAA